MDLSGRLVLICKALWTLLRGSLMHTFGPLCDFKWFTGCKPDNTQRDGSYYRLMTKWSGLGDSTELSPMGLSQLVSEHPYAPEWLD
jgi:hypothetical protein